MPTGEQVEVHMKHRLPGVPVAIEHQAISRVCEPAILGDLSGGKEQLSNARGICRSEIVHRLHVLQWNEEQMDRGLRADVLETQNLIVAVNDSRRELTIPNFAKRAAAHALLILESAHGSSQ